MGGNRRLDRSSSRTMIAFFDDLLDLRDTDADADAASKT